MSYEDLAEELAKLPTVESAVAVSTEIREMENHYMDHIHRLREYAILLVGMAFAEGVVILWLLAEFYGW
jgi:hypothetical protein